MTTSPYDSLPSGNIDITPKTESETIDYIDIELPQPQAPIVDTKPAPVPPPAPTPLKPAKTIPFTPSPKYSTTSLRCLHGCYEYIMPFEESLLVPDTMPDIKKILFAEGRADLTQPTKAKYDRNDFLAGNITAYTVYVPAPAPHSPAAGPAAYIDSPVDVVKSIIPFKTDKCWNEAEGDSFRVTIRIKSITAEMINERKFIVKGELLIKMTGISSCELKLFKSAADENLITSKSSVNAAVLVNETSDTIEISQEISLKSEMPAPLKILKVSNDILETHRQITSGKLIINACISSDILYLGEDTNGETKPVCMTGKTDFTQFVIIDEKTAPDLLRLSFTENDLAITIENKDKFLLKGNVTTLIQAYQNKELRTVCDAYHKEKNICFDQSAIHLNSIRDTITGEISSREIADVPDSANLPVSLICAGCGYPSVEETPEKNRLVLSGSIPVKILAVDGDNKPFIIEHNIPLRGAFDISAENMTTCTACSVKELWYSEINSRQIELNACLGINIWVLNKEKISSIDNLSFAESDAPCTGKPMAIYVVGKGDTLWDIAKKYKSDMKTLAELNDLDPHATLPEGAKLLITK